MAAVRANLRAERSPYSRSLIDHLSVLPNGLLMLRARFLVLASLALTFSSGCQCVQQIEQWKCDNWGMCHFAPRRPGVYSPMVLPPSYGVPPTGLAPVATTNPVYPTSPMMAPAAPPVTYAAPAAAPPAYPYGGAVVPSGNCRECQK